MAATSLSIDTLVLDWNGTVMDDLTRALDATNAVLASEQLPPVSPGAFRLAFRLPLSDFFAALGIDAGNLQSAEQLWNSGVERATAALASGARELLDTCRTRRIAVGVVTGADAAVVAADVQRSGLGLHLAWIAGPRADKSAELAAVRATLGSGTVAFVGDTVHDIQHAKRAGVVAIAYTGGYTAPEMLRLALPDHTINRLDELVHFLAPGESHQVV